MSRRSLNEEVSYQLKRIGFLSKNEHGRRAYYKAAKVVAELDERIDRIPDLLSIPSVGKSIALEIQNILDAGESKKLRKLEQCRNIPISVQDLTAIPGIGEAKAIFLYQKYNIRTLENLRDALADRVILDKKLLKDFQKYERQGGDRMPSYLVLQALTPILKRLKRCYGVEKVTIAGSLRRRKETCKDIDIVVQVEPGTEEKFLSSLASEHFDVESSSPRKVEIPVRIGVWNRTIDLHITYKRSYGACLNYLTGSADFNWKIRQLAKNFRSDELPEGVRVNRYGFFDRKKFKAHDLEWSFKHAYLGGENELDLFEILDIAYTPPIHRQSSLDVDKASPILKWQGRIGGCLHNHTNIAKDASVSVSELIEKAIARGFEFIGISDHNKLGLGLDSAKLLDHIAKVRTLGEQGNIKVYCGAEVDINMEGGFDIEDSVLRKLDYMIMSIHRGKSQNVEDRLVKAIKNVPVPAILGHVTGRFLGKHDWDQGVEWDYIFKKAAKKGILIEINCNPNRLDPPINLIRKAKKCGCRFILSSDSHHGVWSNFQYGYWHMLRARLKYSDVVRVMEEVEKWIKGIYHE